MSDDRFVLPERESAPALYARFWARAFAFLVDFFIFCIPAYLFLKVLRLTWAHLPAFAVLFVLAALFYNVPFESSALQATPGKWLFGLQVTDLAGERIHVQRATIRYLAKFLSALILGMGFQMMMSSKRRQTLHDRLAGTYVVQKNRLLALKEARELKVSEKLVSVMRGLLVTLMLTGATLVSVYVMQFPSSHTRLLQSFCETLPMDMNRSQLSAYANGHGYKIGESKGDTAQLWLYQPDAPGAGRCVVQFKNGKLSEAVYKSAD